MFLFLTTRRPFGFYAALKNQSAKQEKRDPKRVFFEAQRQRRRALAKELDQKIPTPTYGKRAKIDRGYREIKAVTAPKKGGKPVSPGTGGGGGFKTPWGMPGTVQAIKLRTPPVSSLFPEPDIPRWMRYPTYGYPKPLP